MHSTRSSQQHHINSLECLLLCLRTRTAQVARARSQSEPDDAEACGDCGPKRMATLIRSCDPSLRCRARERLRDLVDCLVRDRSRLEQVSADAVLASIDGCERRAG